MTKKIYVDVFVFLLVLIYRRHLSPPVRKHSARFSMFRSWAKILFLSNKTFQVVIFENIHINKSYIIKLLVNIWKHGKN